MPKIFIDDDNIKYYKEVPSSFKLAKLSDFVTFKYTDQGKTPIIKVGIEFIVYSYIYKVYYIYHVSDTITTDKIKQFIKEQRVYIKGK